MIDAAGLNQYGREIAIGAAGAVGAWLFTKLRAWYKSGDQAKAKAEAVGRAAARRDEALERRAEDRYVLKEVCEKCESGWREGMDALRDYVKGIDNKTDAIGADVRRIRDHLLEKG